MTEKIATRIMNNRTVGTTGFGALSADLTNLSHAVLPEKTADLKRISSYFILNANRSELQESELLTFYLP